MLQPRSGMLIFEGSAPRLPRHSVCYSGGGQIRGTDAGKDWDFETMRRAANGFPEKVALYPQRTQYVLTREESTTG